jgi:transposase
MPTLPKELRERVHEVWSDGDTVKDVAETFWVGTATVKRWVRLKRETGALDPLPRTCGFVPFATEERTAILREIVAEHPDWNQERLAELSALAY